MTSSFPRCAPRRRLPRAGGPSWRSSHGPCPAAGRWSSSRPRAGTPPETVPSGHRYGQCVLVAALNGNREPGSHGALPVTTAELAADAVRCVQAGAGSLHLHPRAAASGLETLDPAVVDPTVAAVRAASGVAVGVSTGAWIEPDPARRADAVSSWTEPDAASVNFNEDGAEDVAAALLRAGIAVEAGIWSVADAERLVESGLGDRIARALVEVVGPTEDPVGAAMEIRVALARLGVVAPLLVHGEEASSWPLLRHGLAEGLDVRIGFEDSFCLPDGAPAASNAELVAAASRLAGRAGGLGSRGTPPALLR